MFTDLLHSSYFSLFLIVALGFMLGRVKIKGLSLDVSAVIFIALLFGHFGVIIPKELGNFGLVLFIFTIGIQAGPGFFDSFRSKGKTLILITMLIICSACLTAVGLKYAFDIDTPSVVGLIAGALTSTPNTYGYFTATYTPIKPLSIALSGTYTGSMLVPHEPVPGFLENPITVNTKDFFDIGLKAAYDFKLYKSMNLQINAGIQNIFNAYQDDFDKGADRDSGYIYGPSLPRSFFAGVKISY